MSLDEMVAKIFATFGNKDQANKLAEEHAELQSAIRAKDPVKEEVLTELADVHVLLRQFQVSFGITNDEIDAEIDRKVKRTIKRIRYGKYVPKYSVPGLGLYGKMNEVDEDV